MDETLLWRRWAPFLVQVSPSLAQVRFLVGDLHRKTVSYALQWRRSPSFFLTCAKNHRHLRQPLFPQAFWPAIY